MVSLGVSELRSRMKDCIGRVAYGGQRIVIKQNGKTACALVSVEDLKLLEAIEEHADLKAALQAKKETENVNWEDMKQEFGL